MTYRDILLALVIIFELIGLNVYVFLYVREKHKREVLEDQIAKLTGGSK